MALVALSKQDDYDLSHSEQDCRGRTAVDLAGKPIGTVADMIVDTSAERVHSIVLDNGAQVPVEDIALRGDKVIVRVNADETYDDRLATDDERTLIAGANMRQMVDRDARQVGAAQTRERATSDQVALPVIEEQIRVGKRQVERGGVHVQQHVTETPVEETVSLREEHVGVERRPVNQPVDATNMEAFKEGVIEVTEMGEEAVVSKQARVVEEVVVGKEVTEHQETVRDTVRRTDVEVEQLDANTSTQTNANRKRN